MKRRLNQELYQVLALISEVWESKKQVACFINSYILRLITEGGTDSSLTQEGEDGGRYVAGVEDHDLSICLFHCIF